MAFTFNVNNVHTDINAGLLQMKTLLVAAGWTVPNSGDGRSAGPAGDVLSTSSFGVDTDNALGNIDSWFRLVDPNGRELLFQNSDSSGLDEWIIRYSPSAGFTGTGNGAPDPSIAPTASDEVLILGTFTIGINQGQEFGGLIGGSSQVWDYAIGDASEDYSFYALPRFSPGGNYHGGILYDVLTNVESTDQDPIVIWTPGSQVQSVGTNTNFHAGAIRDMRWQARPKNPGSSQNHGATEAPWAFQRDPATEPGMWSVMLGNIALSAGTELFPHSGFNVYDGNFDVILGVDWFHSNDNATLGSLPTGYNPGAARGAYKGRSRLIAGRSGNGLNNMDTDTGLTKVYQGGTFESFWMIWDGSTTPVL